MQAIISVAEQTISNSILQLLRISVLGSFSITQKNINIMKIKKTGKILDYLLYYNIKKNLQSKFCGKEQTMNWKTTTIHLTKGAYIAVYRDSALFFR